MEKESVTHLLLHLLDLPDGASRLAVLVAQQVDVQIAGLAELLLLLFLCVFQLTLRTDALSVVHVVGLHHLQTKRDRYSRQSDPWRVVKLHSTCKGAQLKIQIFQRQQDKENIFIIKRPFDLL